MPFSARFTFITSVACSSMLMFLCITPIPPSCAMAIASNDSVTVSIPAETIGMFKRILRVKWVDKLTSLGNTSL